MLFRWWRRLRSRRKAIRAARPAQDPAARTPAPAPARELPTAGTITAQRIQFHADRTGLVVRKRAAATNSWAGHLELAWVEVGRLIFDTDGIDPVVSLFVVPSAGGRRRYVTDSKHLTRQQWVELADLVAGASSGRVTIDLASREYPRSVADS